MKQQDDSKVAVVSEATPDWVRALQNRNGKHIWIFGGGGLFRSFLDFGRVDTVEVTVLPVLLGGGIPLLPPP
jgi:dihydrofolate reductase